MALQYFRNCYCKYANSLYINTRVLEKYLQLLKMSQNNLPVSIKKEMPDGSVNEVNIKVAGIVPFLVMKGMALWERYKEKHAYDIYFTILHYPGGIGELIRAFEPFKSNKLVIEGLGKIKAKFNDINATGPVWIVSFEGVDDEEEKERVKRDAYERVNAFLEELGIEEFREG